MKFTVRSLAVLLITPASLLCQMPASSSATTPLLDGHGLYYQTPHGFVPIVGQAIGSARAGSPLSAAATFGLKSMKLYIQIPGGRATNHTDANPVFYYRPPWGTDAVGGSAGDLVLVRMSVKHGSRSVQVGAVGSLGANAGIASNVQLQVLRKQIRSRLYELSAAAPLQRGEYAFYLFRGYDLPGYLYDFSVE